ncbi:MAG: YggS family pyridoxal phosphate-dependent enzyme [Proteobacteria bacterium]|nr:YggS family pyridoxal phosphate-dependent enzyme [SAR86 cluster bacterium]MDA0344547.1 YggS family pyridoxal phosphate-dependent enzyme [Pseudomonadota bacterium]MDA0899948.1 YggS family pyridoxal phosphate-dependent enzyme [Pseudomonadota bacterium]MDA1056289.1 YggS family pyridoxal phosphate-dependent enzyme [Pseudomonadota bacterium]
MDLDIYHKIVSKLPKSVRLIAVSKGQSTDKILELYNAGQRHFGENFEQELTHKKENLPNDIKWHFLGNIQTNKLKKVSSSSYLIQSVSRKKILDKLINLNDNKAVNILLQYKLGNENTKSGFGKAELIEIHERYRDSNSLRIIGLMGIAENSTEEKRTQKQFEEIAQLYNELKSKDENISTLSIGMSSDYNLAIQSGSNMIRLGTVIFGNRR